MDREDRRRYMVVGAVILEVVTPLFQQKIKNDYTTGGFGSFQAFINSQNVIHKLFHIWHGIALCCEDQINCRHPVAWAPLISYQWKKLYSRKQGLCNKTCHCQYTANPVQLTDIDISLSSVILISCCTLSQNEKEAVQMLRENKNKYLSHNTKGCISQTEFNTLWPKLVLYVSRLDSNKREDVLSIENRPLDEYLLDKYHTCLLDLHEQIESTTQKAHSSIKDVNSSINGLTSFLQLSFQRIDTRFQQMETSVQGLDTSIQGISTKIQGMETTVHRIDAIVNERVQEEDTTGQEMRNSFQRLETSDHQTNDLITELLRPDLTSESSRHTIIPPYNEQLRQHGDQYLLGKNTFYPNQQVKLDPLANGGLISDIKMLDDGRLVFCVPDQSKLLICNSDGSNIESIQIRGKPCCLTPINSSTIAVVVMKPFRSSFVELYEVNTKRVLKRIQVPGMKSACGISAMHNKLIVGGKRTLLIVDLHVKDRVQMIKIRCTPEAIHASGTNIFFKNHHTAFISNERTKLKWYSFPGKKIQGKILSSDPCSITSLRDGSLYVLCKDGSLRHVSSDLQHVKTVNTNYSEAFAGGDIVSYNAKRNTMVLRNKKILNIFQVKQ